LDKPARKLSIFGILSLTRVFLKVIKARNTLSKPQPPLLVKISPDLSDEELDDISDVAVATGVDGIIISNTTISRADTLFSGKYKQMIMGAFLSLGILIRRISLFCTLTASINIYTN